MKKLGLIGGTGPESTVIYYHDIVYGVQARLGTKNFPCLSMESVDVYHSLALCAQQRDAEYIAYFTQAIENLEKAGADFAAISANTPHIFFDEIQKNVNIPLVSIVDAAREEAQKRGYKKLLLLGTRFTMQSDFYQKACAPYGINIVVPNEEEIAIIGAKIADELELGIKNPQTLALLQKIIVRIKRDEGAEAVILGCTELPLLLSDAVSPLPCLDTMKVHIQKIIDMIME